jgi:hypothetical protein
VNKTIKGRIMKRKAIAKSKIAAVSEGEFME